MLTYNPLDQEKYCQPEKKNLLSHSGGTRRGGKLDGEKDVVGDDIIQHHLFVAAIVFSPGSLYVDPTALDL